MRKTIVKKLRKMMNTYNKNIPEQRQIKWRRMKKAYNMVPRSFRESYLHTFFEVIKNRQTQ